MSELQKEILYTVKIEGQEEALGQMSKLRASTEALKEENKKLQKEVQEGTKTQEEIGKEYERNVQQIGLNRKAMNDLGKSIRAGGKDMTNMRTRLTQTRQELQRMQIAGQAGTKEFMALRKEASFLQDSIDQVSREIKVFADDLLVMNVAADSAKGVASGFQAVASVTALMGFESEKFAETMQKLVALQTLVNSLQSVQNILNAKGRVIIVGKALATKGLIAVQTLWNKALATTLTLWNALGIGLIIAAIAGLVMGIRALVKNFDAVVDALKRVLRWMAFWKSSVEETIETVEDYVEVQERLLEQSERLQTELSREIERMKAKGVAVEDLIDLERELIEEEIRASEIRLKLAFMESAALDKTVEEREAAQKAFEDATDELDKLWHKLELFDIRERRRQKENTANTEREIAKRKEARRKEMEQEMAAVLSRERREKEAALRLAIAREETFENELALLTHLHLRELEEMDLTHSERLLKIEQYNANKRALEEKWREETVAQEEVWAEEDDLKEIERMQKNLEAFQRMSESRMEAIERSHTEEMAKLDELLENKMISDEQYHEYKRNLETETANMIIDLYEAVGAASIAQTKLLIGNLSKLAGNEEEFAGFKQALAIAESIWAISTGLARTLQAGFPQNIPLAIGFAAQTAGLLANIKAAAAPKKPSIKAAEGAVVGGLPHSLGGTKYYGEDGNVVEFERDEYLAIINKRDAGRAALLDSVNRRHGKALFSNVGSGFHKWGGIEMPRPRSGVGREDMSDMVRDLVREISSIPVVNVTRETFEVQRKVQNLQRAGDL